MNMDGCIFRCAIPCYVTTNTKNPTMKKIFVLVALSFVIFTVFAQDSHFSVGVEAAAIRNRLWGEDVTDVINPFYGVSTGLNLEYSFNPYFSLISGLLYERKGFTDQITLFDADMVPIRTQDHTIHLDYLIVPLMVSYSTNGIVSFYVSSGTYFGFLLNNIGSSHIWENIGSFNEQTISVKDIKTIDFGLSLGCGLVLPIGERSAFDFGFRDNLGLINIFKPEIDGKARMNTIGIVVALKYRF
jgi:hypothetical protein